MELDERSAPNINFVSLYLAIIFVSLYLSRELSILLFLTNKYTDTKCAKDDAFDKLQVSLAKLLGDERAIGLLSVVLLFNTSGISPGRMKNSWHCDHVQERTWETLLKYFTTKISNTGVVIKRMDDAVRVVNVCHEIRTEL